MRALLTRYRRAAAEFDDLFGEGAARRDAIASVAVLGCFMLCLWALAIMVEV